MGPPLAGSDMRAYVLTGGGAYLSRKAVFRPKVRSRCIKMIFPLQGSERSGMVSVEVKKKQVCPWAPSDVLPYSWAGRALSEFLPIEFIFSLADPTCF
jgi:hypothetical protein